MGDLPCHLFGGSSIWQSRHRDDEFIAAQAGHQTGVADLRAEAFRRFQNHVIAGRMAVLVVDCFESVDVAEEHGQWVAGIMRGLAEEGLHRSHQRAAVGQFGQGVVAGLESQLFTGLPLLGDIAETGVSISVP